MIALASLAAGKLETGQLILRHTRKIGDIRGKIRRKPNRTNFIGKAMTPIVFHGTGLRRIGLRIERGR